MTAVRIELPPKLIPVFEGTADVRGAYGGRGSAKTRSFAIMTAVKAVMWDQAGVIGQIVCGRQFMNSLADSSFAEISTAIRSTPWLDSFFEIGDKFIRTKSRRIYYTFCGLDRNIDSLKSKARILLGWVDEAETVSDIAWSKFIPTIREEGSELWVTWNPEKEDSATNVRFRLTQDPLYKVVEINYTDNPRFTDKLRRDLERDRKRCFEEYLWIWEGKYRTQSEATVFKNWVDEEFTAPDDAEFRFGADWGFAIDPTTLVRCYIIGRRLYVDYEAYMVGCEIQNTPDLFMQVPQSERWAITADSARPETIQYMRTHGYPKIMAAAKGPGSVEDGIEWLKSFDMIIHPRCVNLIKELKDYSYKIDKLTGKVLPLLEDKNNHLIDALRYACEGARRAGRQKERDSRIKTVESIPVAHRWR